MFECLSNEGPSYLSEEFDMGHSGRAGREISMECSKLSLSLKPQTRKCSQSYTVELPHEKLGFLFLHIPLEKT